VLSAISNMLLESRAARSHGWLFVSAVGSGFTRADRKTVLVEIVRTWTSLRRRALHMVSSVHIAMCCHH
jgi:hypothetical protein